MLSLHVTVMNFAVWMLLSGESNCCLSLYIHVAGDYDRVLEHMFGVLESPGIYYGQDSRNCDFGMHLHGICVC